MNRGAAVNEVFFFFLVFNWEKIVIKQMKGNFMLKKKKEPKQVKYIESQKFIWSGSHLTSIV